MIAFGKIIISCCFFAIASSSNEEALVKVLYQKAYGINVKLANELCAGNSTHNAEMQAAATYCHVDYSDPMTLVDLYSFTECQFSTVGWLGPDNAINMKKAKEDLNSMALSKTDKFDVDDVLGGCKKKRNNVNAETVREYGLTATNDDSALVKMVKLLTFANCLQERFIITCKEVYRDQFIEDVVDQYA